MTGEYCLKDAPRADEAAPCVKDGEIANMGLRCPEKGRRCERCGFNPGVRDARVRRIRGEEEAVRDG